MSKKIQTTQKSFSVKPKADTGDFIVTITYESVEGPGMIPELIKTLTPMNKQDVILGVDLAQKKINFGTGEVEE